VVSGELFLILGGRDSYGLILMYPNIGYWIFHIFWDIIGLILGYYYGIINPDVSI